MKKYLFISLLYITAATFFVWGWVTVEKQLFPYEEVKEILHRLSKNKSKALRTDWPHNHVVNHTPRLNLERGTKLPYKDHYLLVASLYKNKNALRLVGENGETVKEWVFDVARIFKNKKKKDFTHDLHGAKVLPDGSVLANIEGKKLFRLGKCSEVLWGLKGGHHSVNITDRNTIWVPLRRDIIGGKPYLPKGAQEDHVTEVDMDGNILQSFSLIDLFYENNLTGLLYIDNLRSDVVKAYMDIVGRRKATEDFFLGDFRTLIHINEVEELSEEMAQYFPMFEAGDVMVSFRRRNMVLVFSPKTKKIKWYYMGAIHSQHDPDFQPNGKITIFDNNFRQNGGSRILEVDPKNNEAKVLYGGKGEFFTHIRGKHSVLPDGNILVVEFMTGRVFIVDREGNTVYEYTNSEATSLSSIRLHYEITSAELIPKSYFTEDITCPTAE